MSKESDDFALMVHPGSRGSADIPCTALDAGSMSDDDVSKHRDRVRHLLIDRETQDQVFPRISGPSRIQGF